MIQLAFQLSTPEMSVVDVTLSLANNGLYIWVSKYGSSGFSCLSVDEVHQLTSMKPDEPRSTKNLNLYHYTLLQEHSTIIPVIARLCCHCLVVAIVQYRMRTWEVMNLIPELSPPPQLM